MDIRPLSTNPSHCLLPPPQVFPWTLSQFPFVPKLGGPPKRGKKPSYLLLGTVTGSLGLSYVPLQLQCFLQVLPSLLCILRDLGPQLIHLLPLPQVLSFQCPCLGCRGGAEGSGTQQPP